MIHFVVKADVFTVKTYENLMLRVLRVRDTQVSFKMRCWRHWRLVWAQMRS